MIDIKTIKISVAIATYNGEKYLKKQLDSIYSQTLLPYEVIVVDDCSVDSTIEILKEYKTKYGLKYVINDNNLGVNNNFFKAISLCSGDFIAICDQDDIWFNEKIEKTALKLLEIQGNKPSVVSSQVIDIDKHGNIFSIPVKKKDSFGYAANLLSAGNVQGCTLMLNRQLAKIILSTYNDSLSYIMYDGYISFVAAMVGNKYNIGDPLMYYRYHDTNVVAKKNSNKPSLTQKINAQFTYVDFIPDTRYKTIPAVYKSCTEFVYNDDIINLVSKIERLRGASFITGIGIILGIKELSLIRKLNIVVKSTIVKVLKLFIV